MSGISHKLLETYKGVINKKPHARKKTLVGLYEGKDEPVLRKTLKDVYEARFLTPEEQRDAEAAEREKNIATRQAIEASRPVSAFNKELVISEITPWPSYTGKYYDSAKKAGKGIAGPGELSVSMVLVQSSNTEDFNKNEQIVAKDAIQGIKHEEGNRVDIKNKYTGKLYEVKQASNTKSVQVGANSTEFAANLQRDVRINFLSLYKVYSILAPEHKQILDKTGELETIFKLGYNYFEKQAGQRGELSRGCIINDIRRPHSHIPKLYKIPQYFTPEILNNPEYNIVSKDVADSTYFLKDLYKVNDTDARIIDNLIKNYIQRKQQMNAEAIVEANNEVFSDFLLIASQNPVFASQQTFAEKVQNYFVPGSRESKQVLMSIFPHEGVFVVSNEGYSYAGQNHLEVLLRIDSITRSKLKVLPRTAETTDSPAEEQPVQQ